MPYTYEIRKTALNAQPGELICEVDSADATFTNALGRSGTWTGDINKPAPFALRPDSVSSIAPRNLPLFEPAATTLWVKRTAPVNNEFPAARGARYVWAGLIWDVKSSTDSKTIQVVAEEYTDYYDHVRVSGDFPANNTPNSTTSLVGTLMNLVSETGSIRTPIAYWNGGNTALYSPQWYEFENRSIGDCIRTLASQGYNSGQAFDFAQSIFHNNEPSPFQTGIYYGIHVPKAGIGKEYPTLEYGHGTLNNLRKVDYTYSARKMGTRVKVGGFGERSQQLRWTQHSPYLNGFRNLPLIDVIHNDQNLRPQSVVTDTALRIVDKIGIPIVSLTAYARIGNDGIPFKSIALGDRLTVRVNDGYLAWRGPLRVQGLGIHVVNRRDEEYVLEMMPDDVTLTQDSP